MRRINRCLNQQLLTICQRTMALTDLNKTLITYLPTNLQPYCHVGSFEKGCLVILIDDAVWATELRYYLPTLRDTLRKEARLYQLVSIKIEMTSKVQQEKAPLKSPSLSANAREIIKETANACTYRPLKEILLRLAID